MVEGLDGSGKTTAIEILKQYYESTGKRVAVTKGIGSGEIGKFLRTKIVEEVYTDRAMNTVAFPLAIMDCVHEVFELRNVNDVIITDRLIGSYYAYEESKNMLVDEFMHHIRRYIFTLMKEFPVQVFIASDIQKCISRINARGNKQFTDSGTESDFRNTLWRFGEYYKKYECIRVYNNSDLETFEQQLLNRVTQ